MNFGAQRSCLGHRHAYFIILFGHNWKEKKSWLENFGSKKLVISVSWLTLMLRKTTTTERILYYTGRIHKIGETHEGASQNGLDGARTTQSYITSAADNSSLGKVTV